jgi:hypothetical protein
MQRESFSERGSGMCKGPETGACKGCMKQGNHCVLVTVLSNGNTEGTKFMIIL